MKTAWVPPAILVTVALVAAAPNDEGRKGVLAPLSKGQRVGIEEKGGGYVVAVMPGVPLGYTVTEVGPDHLVVEDITKTIELRIPLYAIKAVRTTRLPVPQNAPEPGR